MPDFCTITSTTSSIFFKRLRSSKLCPRKSFLNTETALRISFREGLGSSSSSLPSSLSSDSPEPPAKDSRTAASIASSVSAPFSSVSAPWSASLTAQSSKSTAAMGRDLVDQFAGISCSPVTRPPLAQQFLIDIGEISFHASLKR